MRRAAARVAATALVLAAAAGVPAPASAQDRQAAQLGFTTTEPQTAAGPRLDITIRDQGGTPPGAGRIVNTFPQGTIFDFSVPPACEASDAELATRGAAACPPESAVARGKLDADTGPRPAEHDLTAFSNGQNELILVAENAQSRIVSRARVEDAKVTIEFAAPTVVRRLTLSGTPLTKGGATFLRTPPACPARGGWTSTLTFIYRDGVTQRATPTTPCRQTGEPQFRSEDGIVGEGRPDDPPFEEPSDADAPTVRLSGAPKRCVRRSFTLRVRIAAEAGLRHAVVRVDGRRRAVRRATSFALRVSTAGLRRGRHRLEISARDHEGDLGARTIRFRRC